MPSIPVGFGITQRFYGMSDITVIFEWEPEPVVMVDNYTVVISPRPSFHPISNVVFSSPWDVTLEYETVYTAYIVATNCFGESVSPSLRNIELSSKFCMIFRMEPETIVSM